MLTITVATLDLPPYYPAVDKTCWRKNSKLPYANEGQGFIVGASTNNDQIITACQVTDASNEEFTW